MLKGIVTKDDKVWQGHPDVAYFNDTIFVVFRESDHHMARSHTAIKLIHKGKNQSFSKPITIAKGADRFNCPRLSVINDQLYIICDEVEISAPGKFFRNENDETKTKNWIWKSSDGFKWEEPIKTQILGIVPDRICPTEDGYLVATHTKKHFDVPIGDQEKDQIKAEYSGFLVQNVWHSESLEDGAEWTKHKLCHVEGFDFCEASVCRMKNGTYMALLRENSQRGLPAYACHSIDGKEWSSPVATRMFGCHRPVTGVLKSGRVLTTYREQSGVFSKGFWAKNTFACLTQPKSAFGDFSASIILPLDHDKSKRSDSGYTGWVQLPDTSIFVVNYIVDLAKNPYICWYQIREDEF